MARTNWKALAEKLQKKNVRLRNNIKRLKERLSRDPLTGLFTRRGFYDMVMYDVLNYVRQHDGTGGPLPQRIVTIMHLDIDFFKTINDKQGHAAGDTVLRTVAEELSRHRFRDTDIVARFGGDEIVIAFYDATPQQILRKFGQTKNKTARIEPIFVTIDGVTTEVTMSAGLALYRQADCPPGKTRRDVVRHCVSRTIDKADKALYLAKETGRNRIVAFRDKQR